jgi:ADP-dependent NAD(P)H-hydrate dehydratase / NAD(P)H-hydrate epimerase
MQTLPGPILTAAQMRAAEDAVIASGTSVGVLMERAGTAVADAACRFGGGRRVLVLCGPGNNGGDGYVAARILKARGVDVAVAALREPRAPAALRARSLWTDRVSTLAEAKHAPVLIDALFGTGLARPLEVGVIAEVARLSAQAFSIGVDLPSGVVTDDGADLGAVPTNMTLALGSLKPAHLLHPAAGKCGVVRCADIGLAIESTMHVISRPNLPAPGPEDHKYKRGMVVVIGGAMAGAAQLALMGAQRAGAGYVVTTGDVSPQSSAIVTRPCATALDDPRVGSVVIGPGLGRTASARADLDRALESAHPLVLDADAITLLSDSDLDGLKQRSSPVILTPHQGEFSARFGAITGSKIDRASAAASRFGGTIIFKGADTVVASHDGRVAVAAQSTHWLASAGTGDVLAGVAGAMLARGLDAHDAAVAAVWLHNDAARRAGPGLIADDLGLHLPPALGDCI